MKRISVSDVAAEAGVTIGSVSKALNGARHVSPELRARVRSAAEKLGYAPNRMARSLRLGRTGTIGCMVRDVGHPMYGAVVSAIERELVAHGHMLLLANSHGSREREREILGMFERGAMDGAIVTSSVSWPAGTPTPYATAGLPLVMLDRKEPEACDRVCVGHRAGLRAAVEHLFGLGHRRIALFTSGLELRPGMERVAGYLEAHAAAGVAADRSLIADLGSPTSSSREPMEVMLSSASPPTALIALSTRLLSGAVRALHAAGKRVPTDFSVIAIGSPELLELMQPEVTCVRMDLEFMGREAARLMLARVAGGEKLPPQRVDVPTEMVFGGTCGVRR